MAVADLHKALFPQTVVRSPFYEEARDAFRATVRSRRSSFRPGGWGQGEKPVAEICMLKNLATSTLENWANEAMPIFGGAGYLRGAKVERIYRATKVMSIGGAARRMGL
jgi:alkylation response protein AidB-like acyl-CoA dehydrogenase